MMANVRSAVMKLELISSIVHKLKVDCFIACETWFSEKHSQEFTSINSFTTFRSDRQGRIGGGVAIWSHDSLAAKEICIHNKPPEIEMVGIAISPKICLFGFYIPPQIAVTSRHILTKFIIECFDDTLLQYPDHRIVVCGDLNHYPVTDLCASFDLDCLNKGPTYGNSQLDYILMATELLSLYQGTVELPIDNSKIYHRSLLATPAGKEASQETLNQKIVFDLRSSNIASFLNLLKFVDWSCLHDPEIELEKKCDFFHFALNLAFDMSIPKKTIVMSSNDKPWMTPVLKSLIDKRWEAFRTRNFAKYTHYKLKVKKEILKAKGIWVKKNTKTNVWRLVRETSGQKSAQNMSHVLSQYPCLRDAANEINREFLGNCHENGNDAQLNIPTIGQSMKVSESDVLEQLNKLKTKKASPDIPTFMYKVAAEIICEPLTILFNLSLAMKYVPASWKHAVVVPIPKSRKPNIQDLRPVSLLPVPIKILERLVLNAVKKDLINGYGPDQFGFRPKSSTVCALISLHDYWTRCFEDDDISGLQIIAYDFSKAFDRIKCETVMDRLIECSLPLPIVAWIQSYLTQRKQCVRIGAVVSDSANVTSGVPQGSVLSPYLFSLVTGSFDISHLPAHVVKYADDFTVCIPLYKKCKNEHVLSAHRALLLWSETNMLPLNLKKCKILSIPRSNDFMPFILEDVPFVEELKLLGVTFDAKNNWSLHTDRVVRSASRHLFLVRYLKPVLNTDVLMNVFNCMIRSILEYCSPLFIGISEKNSGKLESVQRRFHKILCGSECKHHTLNLLSNRRSEAAKKLFLQSRSVDHILHGLVPATSRSGRVVLPSIRHERRLRSFFVKSAILMNTSTVKEQ